MALVIKTANLFQKSRETLEEVREYLESGTIEELADINEVMRAILVSKNISPEDLENVRLNKLESRGGFSKRIFLKEVIED